MFRKSRDAVACATVNMDHSDDLARLSKVWLNNPYSIYFRINEQESFPIAGLCLGDFIPLKYDDDHAVKLICDLIVSGVITNSDTEIKSISRSIDNSEFVPMDISSLDCNADQLAEGIVLLEALENLPDVDAVAHDTQSTKTTQGVWNVSTVINTPPPESSNSIKRKVPLTGIPLSSVFSAFSSPVSDSSAENSISVPGSTIGAGCSLSVSPSSADIISSVSTSRAVLPSLTSKTPEITPSLVAPLRAGIALLDAPTQPSTSSSISPARVRRSPLIPLRARTSSCVLKSRKENSPPVSVSRADLSSSTSISSVSTSASTCTATRESQKSNTHAEDTLRNRHCNRKSQVWESFVKVDAVSARCKICTNVLKHGGNTTNLKQHLDRKHAVPLAVSVGKKRKNTSEATVPIDKKSRVEDENEDDPAPKKTQVREVHLNKAHGKDEKIGAAFQRMQSFSVGGTSSDKITNAILFMITADNCPLSVVENEGFVNLMKTTVPLYTVPSRRTITRLLDDKYTFLQGMFKREISYANALTLTCDIWSDISNHGYLGVTVHYLLEKKMHSGCLGVFPMQGSHTAHYISEILTEAMRMYRIDANIVTAVVTDNGANIKKAIIDSFGISKHMSCFAHMLSHIVPDSLKATPGIEETITKVKQIVTLTKRSVVASDELRRLQIRDGKTETNVLSFKQDVPTRWNSTLVMIERFLLLHEYVYPMTLKLSGSVDLLTREELDILHDLVLLLKPVENVITEASGDTYVTSSLVLPIIHCMIATIEKRNPFTQIGVQLQAKLVEQSQRRFKDYEASELLSIATILDPRFKKIHFQKAVHCAAAVNKIDAMIKSSLKKVRTNVVANAENISQVVNDASVWGIHDALIVSKNVRQSGDIELDLELKQYLSQSVVARSEDPLKYWETLKFAYPKLYPLALKYLSVVATSVPCERLFSKAGAIKAERRSRLTGKRLNEITFLGSVGKKYWNIQ